MFHKFLIGSVCLLLQLNRQRSKSPLSRGFEQSLLVSFLPCNTSTAFSRDSHPSDSWGMMLMFSGLKMLSVRAAQVWGPESGTPASSTRQKTWVQHPLSIPPELERRNRQLLDAIAQSVSSRFSVRSFLKNWSGPQLKVSVCYSSLTIWLASQNPKWKERTTSRSCTLSSKTALEYVFQHTYNNDKHN